MIQSVSSLEEKIPGDGRRTCGRSSKKGIQGIVHRQNIPSWKDIVVEGMYGFIQTRIVLLCQVTGNVSVEVISVAQMGLRIIHRLGMIGGVKRVLVIAIIL